MRFFFYMPPESVDTGKICDGPVEQAGTVWHECGIINTGKRRGSISTIQSTPTGCLYQWCNPRLAECETELGWFQLALKGDDSRVCFIVGRYVVVCLVFSSIRQWLFESITTTWSLQESKAEHDYTIPRHYCVGSHRVIYLHVELLWRLICSNPTSAS